MLPENTPTEQGIPVDQINDVHSVQDPVTATLCYVSSTLGNRLSPFVRSESTPDVYEALTAAIYLMSSASNQLYVSRESRRLSFERGSWNLLGRSQTVEDMVEAGFFYLQEDDHVKCFFCDCGLKDWDVGDVPEMEHAKFSPLCFFLKSSRGLDWLRSSSPRPPNYPTSYTRQDHDQLLHKLSELLQMYTWYSKEVRYCPTKVLLYVARKFILQRKEKISDDEILSELNREMERQMTGQPEHFVGRYDLSLALGQFLDRMIAHAATTPSRPHQLAAPVQQRDSNLCRHCNTRELGALCLPCHHLSLCSQCSKVVRVCPARRCNQQIETIVRAYLS